MIDDKHLHLVPETAFVEIKHKSFLKKIEGTGETGINEIMPFDASDIQKGVKFGSL